MCFPKQVNLDCCVAHFDGNWKKFAALKQQYGPEVSVHDPGRLGSVLITCHAATKAVKQMAEDFEIELLDDYMQRTRDVVARYNAMRRNH